MIPYVAQIGIGRARPGRLLPGRAAIAAVALAAGCAAALAQDGGESEDPAAASSAQDGGHGQPGDFAVGAAIGLGVEHVPGDGAAGVTWQSATLAPELTAGRFRLGLAVKLRFRFDGGPDGRTWEIRDEDWRPDPAVPGRSFFDLYLPIIRYAHYGLEGEPLVVRLGSYDYASLGSGFVVGDYSNTRPGPPRSPGAPRFAHPLEHLAGVGERPRGDVLPREHSRDLFGSFLAVHAPHPYARHRSVGSLGNGEMSVGLRGHLGQVGHAQHLTALGQTPEMAADQFRHPAAHPGVDLVEHHHRQPPAGRDQDTKAYPRLLSPGGRAGERSRRMPGIDADPELDVVDAGRAGLPGRAHRDREFARPDPELAYAPGHLVRQAPGGGLPARAQALGGFPIEDPCRGVRFFELAYPRLARLQTFPLCLEGGEPLRQLVRGYPVFARGVVKGGEPVLDPGEPLRIGFDVRAERGHHVVHGRGGRCHERSAGERQGQGGEDAAPAAGPPAGTEAGLGAPPVFEPGTGLPAAPGAAGRREGRKNPRSGNHDGSSGGRAGEGTGGDGTGVGTQVVTGGPTSGNST